MGAESLVQPDLIRTRMTSYMDSSSLRDDGKDLRNMSNNMMGRYMPLFNMPGNNQMSTRYRSSDMMNRGMSSNMINMMGGDMTSKMMNQGMSIGMMGHDMTSSVMGPDMSTNMMSRNRDIPMMGQTMYTNKMGQREMTPLNRMNQRMQIETMPSQNRFF